MIHYQKFGFILGIQRRAFKDQDPVNIQASELMGQLHDALQESGYTGHDPELFLVCTVFCLFVDDTGIKEEKEMKRAFTTAVLLWLVSCVQVFAQGNITYPKHGPLPGIDTIPLNAVQLTNEEVQKIFVVSDTGNQVMIRGGATIDAMKWHNERVYKTACKSYIVPCRNYRDTRTAPFTFLVKYPLPETDLDETNWRLRQIEKLGEQGKILTESRTHSHADSIANFSDEYSFVAINGAGNDRSDNFFTSYHNVRYDRDRDVFIAEDGRVIHRRTWESAGVDGTRTAIEAQTSIFTASYVMKRGKPVRYSSSTGCVGAEESCVWLPVTEISQQGTSFQSPTLGAAMASLLAVFPEYDVFDLAALVNTCATRYPSLSGGGVVNIPCVIETICTETGSQSSACPATTKPLEPIVTVPSVGRLENPPANPDVLYATASGISAISGWVCDAEVIEIEINGVRQKAGYGTSRADTQGACGDSDNGFSLLYNWNHLKDGIHTVRAFADDVLFASTRVKVTTLGKEMVWDVEGEASFPFPDGMSIPIHLQWEESLQNYVISDGVPLEKTGFNTVPSITGFLENPSLGGSRSGISAISGWVCDAEVIEIELNGVRQKAGYGTSRADTQGACGDSDNGFSLLYNWNHLKDGIHTVRAFADDVLFASTRVKVTTLGEEMVWGARRKHVTNSPIHDSDKDFVMVEWSETLQNFVIVAEY